MRYGMSAAAVVLKNDRLLLVHHLQEDDSISGYRPAGG